MAFSVGKENHVLGLGPAVSSPSPHRNRAIVIQIFPPSFPRIPALALDVEARCLGPLDVAKGRSVRTYRVTPFVEWGGIP